MDIQTNQAASVDATRRYTIYTVTLLLVIAASLFIYKSSAAFAVIGKVQSTRTFQPRLNVLPIPGSSVNLGLFARSVNYFAVIWPALLFGVLISAAVRVLDPPRWLTRSLARGGARSESGGINPDVHAVRLSRCHCAADHRCVRSFLYRRLDRTIRQSEAYRMRAIRSGTESAFAASFSAFVRSSSD